MIGKHSKQFEGRLYGTPLSAGWKLQMERAAIFGLASDRPFIQVDGISGVVQSPAGALIASSATLKYIPVCSSKVRKRTRNISYDNRE